MWSKSAEGKESSQAPQSPVQETVNPRIPTQNFASAPAAAAPDYSGQASASASTISTGLRIHGELTGTADLFIDGEVQGSLRLAQSKVTVGPRGRVQADIEAREIVVEGIVQGNLKASDRIRLGPASQVQGSLMTPRVAIDDGARLRGRVETARAGESRRAAAASQTKPADPPATPIAAAVKE